MKGKPLVAGIVSLSTAEAVALAKAARDQAHLHALQQPACL
jgi:dihydrodipicolinate synthase/N-acetylneuraminate lyase